jgi:hypothetical protein
MGPTWGSSVTDQSYQKVQLTGTIPKVESVVLIRSLVAKSVGMEASVLPLFLLHGKLVP